MRLRGWLTITFGLSLGVITAYQASRLDRLGREESARDEARGLAAALRWRLELGRSMLDLNEESMRRSLREVGRWPHPLEWAGLFDTQGHPLSTLDGQPPWQPDDADFRATAAAASSDLPLTRNLQTGRFLAMTRFRIGERDLVLAMVLTPEGWRAGAAGIWSTMSICLMALAAAAVLLVWRGASDILSAQAGSGRQNAGR